MTLSRQQWIVLNSLADGDEPFEIVDMDIEGADAESTPQDTLRHLTDLCRMGFVTLTQTPLSDLQDFEEKPLTPERPGDIVADLAEEFRLYCEKRDWIQTDDVTVAGAKIGIPFGVYVEMTEAGRREWEKPDYRPYWPDGGPEGEPTE